MCQACLSLWSSDAWALAALDGHPSQAGQALGRVAGSPELTFHVQAKLSPPTHPRGSPGPRTQTLPPATRPPRVGTRHPGQPSPQHS